MKPWYRMFSGAPFKPKYAEEKETYRRKLPELLAAGAEGKFAAIFGPNVVSVCGTYAEARTAAFAASGSCVDAMVCRIGPEEAIPIAQITRILKESACPSSHCP